MRDSLIVYFIHITFFSFVTNTSELAVAQPRFSSFATYRLLSQFLLRKKILEVAIKVARAVNVKFGFMDWYFL